MVTLYSKPNCQPCKMTKLALDRKGVEYRELDITKDPEALKRVLELGYLQAPVVVTDESHWSGFDPFAIDRIAA